MTMRAFPGKRRPSGGASAVGLFGILGAGNIGNDAQMESVLAYMRREHPRAVVDAMTSGPDRLRNVYGIEAVPLHTQFRRDMGTWEGRANQGNAAKESGAGLAKIVRTGLGLAIDAYRTASWVGRHDVVIVPGGGVLESSLLLRPWGMPYTMFLLCLSGKLFNTKVALVCVGADVINQRVSRFLCVSAAKLAFYRSYRDQLSKDAMRRQGVDTSADRTYADLAFGIPVRKDGSADPRSAGVGVMAYYGANDDRGQARDLHDAYVGKLKVLIGRLVDSGHRVKLFVGDSNGSDASIAEEVLADLESHHPGLGQAPCTVERTQSFAELMESMSAVGSVVAARYHNVVCALKLGKPTVALAYSGKHDALMADMGMAEYCQSIQSFDVDRLVSQLERMAEHPEELRNTMRKRHALKGALLERQFTELSSVLFPAGNARPKYYKNDYWREENRKFSRVHHRLVKSARIISRLARGRECDLLDIGCGPAALMGLLPPNVHYHGVDIAITNPAPNLVEADILQTPIGFGGKKFDIVSAQGVFEYLGDFQLEKFAEIAAVLKPGGKFLVTYWNFDHRRPHVYGSFSHVQRLADFRRALEQSFDVDRCLPVAHNWQQTSPRRPLVRAVNMHLNAHVPVLSSKLAVEYFFLCSPRPRPRPEPRREPA